jgi:hypothetical protein
MQAQLDGLGLRLHPEKTTILEGSQWLDVAPTLSDHVLWRKQAIDTSSLLESGVRFLAAGHQPMRLAATLSARGSSIFALMAIRAQQSDSSAGIAARLATFLERAVGRTSPDEIGSMVTLLRDAYVARVALLCEKGAANPLLERWRIQRLLRIVNRLVLLMPLSDLMVLIETLPRYAATEPSRLVVRALAEHRPGLVLPLAGGHVRQFCYLWTALGRNAVATRFSIHSEAYLESALEMVSRGVVTAESIDFDPLLTNAPVASAMLRSSVRRSNPDLSFDDEIESLLMTVPVQERFRSEYLDPLEDEPLS